MSNDRVQAIGPALPPNHWGEGFWKERCWVAEELMEPSRHLSGGDAGNPSRKTASNSVGRRFELASFQSTGASETTTLLITLP